MRPSDETTEPSARTPSVLRRLLGDLGYVAAALFALVLLSLGVLVVWILLAG